MSTYTTLAQIEYQVLTGEITREEADRLIKEMGAES